MWKKLLAAYVAAGFVTMFLLGVLVKHNGMPVTQEDANMVVISGAFWPLTIVWILGALMCKLVFLLLT